MKNAFTIQYKGISDRLINKISLKNDKKTMEVDALWDSGANISCISYEAAKKMKLKAFGQIDVNTAVGNGKVMIYRLDIKFLNVTFNKKTVYTADIHSQGIDMLIGMDIINLGDFAITNKNGTTKFTFEIPSSRDIDFVEENKNRK